MPAPATIPAGQKRLAAAGIPALARLAASTAGVASHAEMIRSSGGLPPDEFWP